VVAKMTDSYSPTIDDATNRIYVVQQQSKGSETSSEKSSSSSTNSDKGSSSDSAQINSQQTKAKKEADKEYIEKEFTTLQGSLVLMPSEETMLLKVGDIISLDGFGKNLSGAYYISEIERTIDSSSGYTMTLTVVKTAFGGTVVKKEEKKSSGERDKPATVSK
jgi:hypothetical protein